MAHVITMAPKVAGQVTAVYVQDNQRSTAGRTLSRSLIREITQAKVDEHRGKVGRCLSGSQPGRRRRQALREIYAHDESPGQQLDNARAAARAPRPR